MTALHVSPDTKHTKQHKLQLALQWKQRVICMLVALSSLPTQLGNLSKNQHEFYLMPSLFTVITRTFTQTSSLNLSDM